MSWERGFTLLELLVFVILTGILIGTAGYAFRELSNPVNDASSDLVGLFKKIRAKSLATTRAYTIRPTSPRTVESTFGSTCSSGAQTNDTSLDYSLPSGAVLRDTNWSICYSSRGLSNSSAEIVVQDGYSYNTVQVVLGGGVRIQ
jgi:Tfp pilus assembly protein FimT